MTTQVYISKYAGVTSTSQRCIATTPPLMPGAIAGIRMLWTVTSHAQEVLPHSLMVPSSPADASLPRQLTTTLAAVPSSTVHSYRRFGSIQSLGYYTYSCRSPCPSIDRTHVQLPGDQTLIVPSSEQLTTLSLQTHKPRMAPVWSDKVRTHIHVSVAHTYNSEIQ